MTKTIYVWLVSIVLIAVGGYGGKWLLSSGFNSIQELRQLERVPESKASAILPGEVAITAWSEVDSTRPKGSTVKSRYTHTPSLYYRYTREVKKKDSDGKTHWDTVEDKQDSVRFWLVDESGRVLVEPSTSNIHWSVEQSFQTTNGSVRHTEWRIEPGEQVFIFAKAVFKKGKMHLRFDQPGYYTPIISNYSKSYELAAIGGLGLLALWGGLAAIAMALLGVAYILKIHRLLVYLSLLTLVLVIVLVNLSFTMMRQDLQNGLARYDSQVSTATERITEALKKHGIAWSGWIDAGDFDGDDYTAVPEHQRYKLKEYRVNLALNQMHIQQQMEAMPERLLYSFWGLSKPQALKGIPEADWQLVLDRMNEEPQTTLVASWTLYVMLGGGLFAFVFTFMGHRWIRVKRLIENIPCSPTIAVSCGLAEVKGTVALQNGVLPLESPYTCSPCVWFQYKKEEQQGSGKNRRWVVVDKASDQLNFVCKDDEGEIVINPDKAEVISEHSIVKTRNGYRYTESTLQLHDTLYAIGLAKIDAKKMDCLNIQKGLSGDPFILSNLSESEVMLSKARTGMFSLNVAFSGMLLAMLIGFGKGGGFAATDFLMAAMAAPIYMIFMMLVLHYNDLIYLRQRAERNWANIQISLKKRHNLVSSLQKVVKRYFEHEKSLFKQVSILRTNYKAAFNDDKKLDTYFKSEKALQEQFKVTLESYPDLKGDAIIAKLMTTLTKLETELALLRQGYNDSVEVYNQRISTIPDVFLARSFGFSRQVYFGGRR